MGEKTQSLVEQHQDVAKKGTKLIPKAAKRQWLEKKREMRLQMLAEEPADQDPVADAEEALGEVSEEPQKGTQKAGHGPNYHDEEAQKASAKALAAAEKEEERRAARDPLHKTKAETEEVMEEVTGEEKEKEQKKDMTEEEKE